MRCKVFINFEYLGRLSLDDAKPETVYAKATSDCLNIAERLWETLSADSPVMSSHRTRRIHPIEVDSPSKTETDILHRCWGSNRRSSKNASETSTLMRRLGLKSDRGVRHTLSCSTQNESHFPLRSSSIEGGASLASKQHLDSVADIVASLSSVIITRNFLEGRSLLLNPFIGRMVLLMYLFTLRYNNVILPFLLQS